jgi:uncharacterized protein with HEPN domain
MSRDWRLYLGDMILCCEKVTRFVGASGRDDFLANELVYDAVMRNLDVLGEAAKHIPDGVKAGMPDVAWREIAGMRDWLAHGYFTTNPDIVWNVITVEVPLLLKTLRDFSDGGLP